MCKLTLTLCSFHIVHEKKTTWHNVAHIYIYSFVEWKKIKAKSTVFFLIIIIRRFITSWVKLEPTWHNVARLPYINDKSLPYIYEWNLDPYNLGSHQAINFFIQQSYIIFRWRGYVIIWRLQFESLFNFISKITRKNFHVIALLFFFNFFLYIPSRILSVYTDI
jgi:hypothetical protein